jgi:hypothetical protein
VKDEQSPVTVFLSILGNPLLRFLIQFSENNRLKCGKTFLGSASSLKAKGAINNFVKVVGRFPDKILERRRKAPTILRLKPKSLGVEAII